ncbi:hypothetical protein Xaut_1723 [Xanthobacter versatilis]|uniref:DUF3618 domain-containing protein n=2 Tax=Xanthobacter autotrophicus (strain ATCC BAA-1158 / Py2) TaxID=78245 RepID=A7IG25_XANP2|nr:hypothetical protein Xaut_1723 [Xanthobacter autotrophicus Py2]
MFDAMPPCLRKLRQNIGTGTVAARSIHGSGERSMLGWHRQTTAEKISSRIAALKDELDDLQDALWPRAGGLQRMASEAQDWISERADDLRDDLKKVHLPRVNVPRVRLPDVQLPAVDMTRMGLPDVRRHMPTSSSVAVIAAAVVVGAGVGCVLYALTSSGKRRPASFAPKGTSRSASQVVK